jgi:hypothetical protein
MLGNYRAASQVVLSSIELVSLIIIIIIIINIIIIIKGANVLLYRFDQYYAETVLYGDSF